MLEDCARRAAFCGRIHERIYGRLKRRTEMRAMATAPAGDLAGRRELEVACGTGWRAQHGARDTKRWLVTDLNRQALNTAMRWSRNGSRTATSV